MAVDQTPWWSKDTVAVVTGGNKGLGYEIVRELAELGLTVVLTARDLTRGQAAVTSLKAKGLEVFFHPLDVRSPTTLAKWLHEQFGGFDILFNNAGITPTTIAYEEAKDVVQTNYYGQKAVTKALLPELRPSAAGARIIFTSSRIGAYDRLGSESLKQKFRDEENYTEELIDSLAEKFLEDVKAGRKDEGGWVAGPWVPGLPVLSESRMFLNAYARILAKSLAKSQLEGHEIFVASFCPGLAETDLYSTLIATGFALPEGQPLKKIEEGADTGVWLALLPKEQIAEKNGKLFGEREELVVATGVPPA